MSLHPKLLDQKVRSLCDELALKRRALARHKSAECALRVQQTKAEMDDTARQLRASFQAALIPIGNHMTRKFRINTLVKHVDGKPFVGSDKTETTVSGYEADGYVRLHGVVGCYHPKSLELVEAKQDTAEHAVEELRKAVISAAMCNRNLLVALWTAGDHVKTLMDRCYYPVTIVEATGMPLTQVYSALTVRQTYERVEDIE